MFKLKSTHIISDVMPNMVCLNIVICMIDVVVFNKWINHLIFTINLVSHTPAASLRMRPPRPCLVIICCEVHNGTRHLQVLIPNYLGCDGLLLIYVKSLTNTQFRNSYFLQEFEVITVSDSTGLLLYCSAILKRTPPSTA